MIIWLAPKCPGCGGTDTIVTNRGFIWCCSCKLFYEVDPGAYPDEVWP